MIIKTDQPTENAKHVHRFLNWASLKNIVRGKEIKIRDKK